MVDIICIIYAHLLTHALRGTVYERWLPHRWGLIRVLLVARACSPMQVVEALGMCSGGSWLIDGQISRTRGETWHTSSSKPRTTVRTNVT